MGLFDLPNLSVPRIRPPKIKPPSVRNSLPRKRDILQATNYLNKSIREPVSAKTRKEVLKIAKNKCQYPRCTIKEGGYIKLHIHHKNMINSDNKSSNLMALCATHHNVIHKKNKIIIKKDAVGRRLSSRVYTTEKAKQIKREMRNRPIWEQFG
jgi:hypothetical protein